MAGLQLDIYAAISITWVAAFLALSLRLKARRMTKMSLWFDDYFAIIALLFVTSYCSVTIYWTHSYKLGQSILTIADPTEANRIQDRSRLLLWICELLYASSIAFCKLSILCFYWRVFQYTSIRYAIIILLVAVSIWITIRTFMVLFHCVPIRAYWDKSIQGAKCPFNEANFFFATILVHTTMDCVILILPVIEVMKMTLPLSQKLAVVGLFTSGTIVCVASIFVLVHSKLYNPRTDDIPKDMAENMMWAAVEINMAVFSACLPMLRPIFRHFLPGLSTTEESAQAPISLPNVVLPGVRLTETRSKKRESRRSGMSNGLYDPELGVFHGFSDISSIRSVASRSDSESTPRST
ncbi:integral membrane protein [Fusarium fujikuroi]|nr:integral membrane protein [Fusarium fujikuroi]SCO57272.1 related to integral membrane protein [Fusarium fujikuroi]